VPSAARSLVPSLARGHTSSSRAAPLLRSKRWPRRSRPRGGTAEAARVDALDERTVDEQSNAVAEEAGSIDVSFNAVSIRTPAGGKTSALAVARMYAALLGEVDGVRLISPERLREVSAVAMSGVDEVFGFPTSWGLGYSIGQFMSNAHETQHVFGVGGWAGATPTSTPRPEPRLRSPRTGSPPPSTPPSRSPE
jgi:hypothetical protein